MSYGYSKEVNLSFDEVVERTINALKEEGFGILTDIDVKKILKEKLDVDFKQYRILGACNPPRAYKALQVEDEIGLLLPCNVIVYEKNDRVTVSDIRPEVAFSVINNQSLAPLANEVEVILKKVINNI